MENMLILKILLFLYSHNLQSTFACAPHKCVTVLPPRAAPPTWLSGARHLALSRWLRTQPLLDWGGALSECPSPTGLPSRTL